MLTDEQLIQRIRVELSAELVNVHPPEGFLEGVWEQADHDAATRAPSTFRRFGTPRRFGRLSADTVAALAAVLITIVIAGGAVALLSRQHHPPSTAASTQSTRQQLIDILAVLRRPQTKADLAGVRDLPFFRDQGRRLGPAVQGSPDWPLVRLATVTPWGEKLFLVPMKPPTPAALASLGRQRPPLPSSVIRQISRRGETLGIYSRDGGAGGATAASIEANGAGLSAGAGPAVGGRPASSYTRLVHVVPDSVAKVTFLLPRESPTVEPGAPISKHSLIVTVPVHDNVAAVQVDRTQCCDQVPMIWYDAAEHVIKRIGNLSTSTPKPRVSLAEIAHDVMCVSCHKRLNVAQSPPAVSERAYIRWLIAHGETKLQIERTLVRQYGPAVLSVPKSRGSTAH